MVNIKISKHLHRTLSILIILFHKKLLQLSLNIKKKIINQQKNLIKIENNCFFIKLRI